MHFSPLVIVSALSLMAGFAQAAPHNIFARGNDTGSNLSKRVDNARLTWYDVGLGACGQTNVASDFVVALNADDFGAGYPGPHCFQNIVITAEGKTATAQIVDKCPGCPEGGLDLSEGLFSYFANPSVGVLTGSWNYA
ncbi:hypothetical protein NEOLEDRAFT_1176313 [Neolentinus lepideus HHB14362 ss-1]|uniref:RlpA-like protein double-psi beta-barrel domain-containing protein n=1 Tax=Neolentinus lepideus HHB14362 ss-1 TaxID=1314782 RepID=A0A165UHK4_9AGAM|nr:hypothetical protein NEOLEDRAFT_1176313 [Neolentinus lepideus HHB14362 ss-1]